MGDHMEEQPPQKRVKLRNDGFQGTSDSTGKPLTRVVYSDREQIGYNRRI